MDLARTGVAKHPHQLHHGGAAHDGVVDDHQALAGDVVLEGVQLHAHAHGAQLLRGLDERTGHVAVLDETLAVAQSQLMGKALCRRHTGVRHADDHIHVGRRLASELTAHVVAAGVHGLAVHDAVRASEVDLLEDALGALQHGGHALLGHQALGADAQDLARAHVAHVLRTHDVERAGLAGDHPTAGTRHGRGGIGVRVVRRGGHGGHGVGIKLV